MNNWNRSDEYEDRLGANARHDARTHRWLAPALGAVVGILVGMVVVNLAAAYLPEGDGWFSAAGLLLQSVGAGIGALAGAALAARHQRKV